MNNPRIVVAGSGYWGKNLVRNLHTLGVLAGVCDVRAESREMIESQYPGVPVTADFETVLADDSIDGVVIATPAEQHAWMAEAALRAGKDVFVEKPLALKYADGERLVNLAASLNRILMVGHLLEYHPAVLK